MPAVNDALKFIYVHVPKTAGTSIRSVLRSCPGSIWEVCGARGNYRAIKDQELQEYWSFGFVRNPWDRVVSLYYHFHSRRQITGPFKETVLSGEFNGKRHRGGYPDSMIQLEGVDFIGRFETLQDDFDIVCRKIGIDQVKLPRKNVTKHNHYSVYYDEETIDYVARAHAETIERFGYTFEEQ